VRSPSLAIVLLPMTIGVTCLDASGQVRRGGRELAAVPALNFDADEGFGYGVAGALYQYGGHATAPYAWSLEPTVFLTTRGRRDLTIFFHGPAVLRAGWLLDAFLGSEKQVASPYYGRGNASTWDKTFDTEAGLNPYYYRFGRTRRSAIANVQRHLGSTPLRGLVGLGLVRVTTDPVPHDEGTTLYAEEVSEAPEGEWSNFVRVGLVWDSRDRETGPRRGTWTELLVQRVDTKLGSATTFTRWTFTDRRYLPLGSSVVFAHRWLLQEVGGGAPVHELHRVQTSFKQQEGLGGAKTLRGVPKNRFVGRGMMIWNAELRWRFADFSMLGRSFHAVLSAFLDEGRVWDDAVRIDELLTDLHRGYGGGIRLGMGENFVVALDVGTSSETGLPLYVGAGYVF